ncbi:hypothetical protein DSO57_1014945 [Entomophthora muscae]|uniref:Uncharacterized protein n=1 Tax=Entomophthora muscae TaxID=34485 RepID=A0ACC2SU18_9FUNG|nr:hypothetical protein DSO57_1014945 [Entomophthora muscae]
MALTWMMEINPSENSLFVFYGYLFCILQDLWVNLCHVSVYPEFNHFQLLKIRVHLKNVDGPSLMGGAVMWTGQVSLYTFRAHVPLEPTTIPIHFIPLIKPPSSLPGFSLTEC